MVEVTLMCALVREGGGSVFPVVIDTSKVVGLLKKEIKAEKPNTITCDADELQLFLAKKGDAWLKDDDPAAQALDNGVTHPDVQRMIDGEKMKATWTIEDVLTANNMTKRKGRAPKSRQIHVLVVGPEGDRGSVGSSDWVKISNELNIAVEPVDTVDVVAGEGTPVGSFDWAHIIQAGHDITLSEKQQRKSYLEYVERNIGAVLTNKKLCVVGVEKKASLLNVKVRGRTGRDIEFAGATDILILRDTAKKDPSSVQFLPGVQMLIEVKKRVVNKNNFQALSELVALDLRANGPVMALLTDLNETWVFFWVAEKKNNSILIHRAFIDNPTDGFKVIRSILEKSSADVDAQIELPYFEHPVKRLKLRSALPTVTESGGICESIQRYYDIASILGPDLDMARAVANQVTRSIPTYSYFS